MQKNFYLTKKLPSYVFAKIYELKQMANDLGQEIIDFGMGNPDSTPPQKVMQELSQLVCDGKLYGYSPTIGIETLRKAIANFYHRRFNVEIDYKTEAMITIGSKEGIVSLAKAISSSKTYVCVASPCYPIHNYAFIIAGSKTQFISAINCYNFLEKFKEFVENQTHKPQAVIVSYPCNPTGEIADLNFYQELVSFCKKYQILIISDIAYAELYFDDKNKPHSILEVKGAKEIAIEFYSISKSYSMAGARVGFAVGNKDLILALYKIKSYLDYGSFTPLQMVAKSALEPDNDDYLVKIRKLYQDRAEFFTKTVNQQLHWNIEQPKASMFCWTKLPKQFSHLSSFEFCKKMILETGVVFSAGSFFGENGEGYVRISMIHNQQKIQQACENMKKIFSYQI